jgi:DNA-binding transcriptional MerR regulator
MTIPEAAARLGRSKRSITYYLKKGLLKREATRNRKVLLRPEDVEQLAEELGTDFPVINRRTIFQLNRRVMQLEEEMQTMKTMWAAMGLREEPLRMNVREMAGLFKAVTDYLALEKYQLKELDSWAGIFNQVDETTIEQIGEASGSAQPWKPLLDLATKMSGTLSPKVVKTDLALQALQAKMEQGRKKVRAAALFWIESGKGTIPQGLFQAMDTPQDELRRAIVSKNG